MTKKSLKWIALLGGIALGASSVAHAQDSGALINLLTKKGIINDQEAEDLRSELSREFVTNTSAGKLNLAATNTEFRISGDVRVRYEYRGGVNDTTNADSTDRSRFRYRVRPLISGNVGSQFFYGVRLEAANKSRSSNVTMAGDNGTSGPFGKADDAVYFGQVYLGYKPITDLTIWAGRMPNPLVSTSLVWDGDINPEGLAEQYKKRVGKLEYTATLGQFIYDSANPQNSFGSTANVRDQYLYAFQGVVKGYLNEAGTNFVQIAPTFYSYAGTEPSTQKAFKGYFSKTTANGINDLFVLDIPVEYTFVAAGTTHRIFGDYAINLDASTRAERYNTASATTLSGEDQAYQLGYQYGKAKLKGEWDAKVYYQATGLFALDQNLVDSDIFDSRLNMQGFVVGVNYQLNDAVTATLTYADGSRKSNAAPTLGVAGEVDLGSNTVNLTKYRLLQADIVLKF